ncbi:N5-glutamine methyltransferase family protein [Adlercreutzia murintestinalis]|uniref:N5-glutamine methyltransferase family protein n=1 Tax=Adlercreutzia murintestinalis TaxID=2941325 RepID=UPI002041F1E9|nr:HemK/PrmC family methyltransferase [Adlercreutzia murintestinalis]
MEQRWTTKAALDWCAEYLARKGDRTPRRSAERLVCDAARIDRIQLIMDPDRPLSEDERAVLRDHVARRGAGEPLQYITGEAPFRFLSLCVRPGVLIPRPETEVLVSEVLTCLPKAPERRAAWNAEAAEQEAAAVAQVRARLSELRGMSAPEADDAPSSFDRSAGPEGSDEASVTADADAEVVCDAGQAATEQMVLVADLCTGSGCIACSLASEREDVRVIATDLSADAVALARENVEALELAERVRVLQGDLGAPIPERYLGRFDAVVANPPYIPTAVMAELPAEVGDFEPDLALHGGADGLDVYRRILGWAQRALAQDGLFAVELYEGHLDEAAALAVQAGFAEVRVVEDLAGRPRVLVARWREQ